MEIGFEILHYQSTNDTIDCVNSILKYIDNPLIVIVDNASPNKSGLKLQQLYRNYPNITVIISEKNLGFAKGNNIGYRYIRNNYNCKYICCINNDTRLIDYGFKEKLDMLYSRFNFGVFAPSVKLPDGSIQSFNPQIHSLEYYEKEICYLTHANSLKEYHCSKGVIGKLFYYFPNIMRVIRIMKQKIRKPYPNYMLNVVLHGCFVVFSELYISIFEDAFCPKTFMFREEELLFLKTREAGLSTLYSGNIEIFHNEDSATNYSYPDQERKYQFMRENQIKSTKILIEELRKKNNEEWVRENQ